MVVGDFYNVYRWWCKGEGIERPLSKQKFGKILKAMFPGVDQRVLPSKDDPKSKARTWVGLRVPDDGELASILEVIGKAA